MTHPPPTVDPNRCPLCGGDNLCAMEIERATGQPQPPCWCLSSSFAPELLAQLPAQADGLACICARCVAAHAARSEAQ